MFIKKIILHQNSVSIAVADENTPTADELFLLSLGEWKRVNRALGYDPDAEMMLTEGTPVDESIYDAVRLAAEKTGALRLAARMLENSDQSTSALLRKLEAKGFSPEASESAVSLLEKRGYLNDADACRNYAESAVRTKHYGRQRIYAYLISHGYARDAAREAVDALPDEQIHDALLWQISRKFPELAKDPAGIDRAQKQKAVQALMRLGFSTEEILSAFRELGK